MTQEQAEKTRKARMTFETWADAEKLTTEQRERLNRADRAAVVPCAVDAMKHEALAGKISRAEAEIEGWRSQQAEFVYAVETLDTLRAKAKAD